jgi:hypothetical protein
MSHPLVLALLAEIEDIDREIAILRAKVGHNAKAIQHLIEEAQRIQATLLRIAKHAPGRGHALVSLPTTDPVLADFLDHVGYGDAATILRLAAVGSPA